MRKTREALCKHLESVSRSDLRAEGWKRQALPYLAIGATLMLCTGVTMGLAPANDLVQTFGPWCLGVGAVVGLAGGGLYLSGSAGDVLDRRYQGLLYLLRHPSFADARELDLRVILRRRTTLPLDEWGHLSGRLPGAGSAFTLQLATRYWTECDTMDEESTYRDDNGDLQTTTRTVMVHRRDFEQDLVRLVVERDSGWEAERLKRHLSPRASLHLAVSEVRPQPGKLEAEFVSGVARTVSGEGMAVEEIAHDGLLNSLSLREVFQWLEEGEARAAEEK